MKCCKSILFILVFFLVSDRIAAQTNIIDSLKYRVEKAMNSREKLAAIYELCDQTMNADSLYPYVLMAEKISLSTGNRTDPDKAAFCRASYYVHKNIPDSALAIVDPLVVKYKKEQEQQPFYLKLIFCKTKILDRANQYTLALAQLMEVIQTAELLNDTLIQIQAKTGIGWVQMEMGQYNEALQWLMKALHTSPDIRFYKNYGALYSNLASAYNSLGKRDSARYYINKAISDARENQNLLFLATALSMQAQIFIDGNQPHLAEQPLHEVVDIRKKLNDPFYIVYDMSSLASYYARNGQPDKGIELCKEGIMLAKERGMPSQLMMIYRALAENYKMAGNKEEYGRTLEYIIALKDSFNGINSSKMLAEMQAGSDKQKTEKTIVEQKLRLTQKNYWLYGSFIFTMMTAIIVWLGFNSYRRRQEIRMQFAVEEEKRNAAKAVTDAEEQERKRIAADLHDNLGAYAASIVSNLDHISLQQVGAAAALPMQELRNNSQAIVSQLGDTIWAMKKNALSLTAISDKLKTFIQRIQPSYPGIQIEVKESLKEDLVLSSSHAFHLYRVVQEALNNALKHSGGKHILIEIISDKVWVIRIKDDGRGIPGSADTLPGNGLENMKARCRESGWSINWHHEEGGGMNVVITPTTN